MRVTKRLFTSVAPVALLALAVTPAFAQSTGTAEVETVVVTGTKVKLSGMMTTLEVPKQRSVITQDFITTQPSGQTVFDTLNLVPGLNFTNSDPYGNSGGNIRMHGMDGNRISFTWDGMPLNDTGNYATYTHQVVDTEIIDRASVNQGTTDVDSPTASSTGGVINIRTAKPAENWGVLADTALGSFNYRRAFFRVDSGEFGPWGTRAFATYSYTMYDKFKGPGNLQKNQINADIYQGMGDLGWINLAAHFNRNRNDQYNGVSFLPVQASTLYPSVDAMYAVSAPNVALDANGQYTGTDPTALGGFGLGYDEDPTCTRTAVAGTAQKDGCTGFYKVRVNPSDTGNVRLSSLWHLSSNLTFTFDTNFQYVLANGGGYTNVSETDAKLVGATTGTVLTGSAKTNARVTPYTCLAGNGCDLNGDGDILDTVGEFTPNNTNTRRYGINAQLIYAVNDENTLQFAYVFDWGLHRQTGQWSTFDDVNGPADFFGGLRDADHQVKNADGYALRQRDRKSYASLNQFSFNYEGRYLQDSLRVSVGVRLPFFDRELHQYCYNQTTGYGYCTTASPKTGTVQLANLATMGLYKFDGYSNYYTKPGDYNVTYSRTLPNAGISWLPFGPEHQFFTSYAQGISVPRTDNLYNGGTNGDPSCKDAAKKADTSTAAASVVSACRFGTFATNVSPETTATYNFGYRFTGEWASASVTLWNTQYKNRIVSTYDPSQGISVDHNIGNVNMDGIDFEGTLSPIDNLDIYQSVSFLHSRVVPGPNAFLVPGTDPNVTVSIAGKEVVETPNWTEATRIQYRIYGFQFGLGGKYVSRRYGTDTNDYRVPDYFVANADVRYDLTELGWDKSYLKFNVTNLLDRNYFGNISTTRNCFTPYAATKVAGCTSYPLLSVGSPRTFQVELRSVF
jgi:iron complex outermembrane receptor protein